jgi:hypothetical protein
MKITAAQHVFGILTAKQSPRGDSGYQTVLSTNGLLTQEQVRLIERLVSHGVGPSGKPKWLSHGLPGRRTVVTRVIPIAEPDEFGRRGRYFAHSLVFNSSDLRLFDDFPFPILQVRHFFPSLDDVLACDGLQSGNVPAVSIEVERESVQELLNLFQGWSGEELNRFVMLMNDPKALIDQGQQVAFIGSEQQIMEALRVAILLAPFAVRELCSFDTNAVGIEWQGDTAFWGYGFPSEGDSSARFVVDAAMKQVKIPEASPLLGPGFIPEQLSPGLQHEINARLSRHSTERLQLLINQRFERFISESVYETILDMDSTASTADLELLEHLNGVHRKLAFLLALRSGSELRRLRALSEMSLEDYGQVVKDLKSREDFRAWQVFSPTYLPSWFALCQGLFNVDDLVRGLQGVSEHGTQWDRTQVSAVGDYLDQNQGQELQDWLSSPSNRLMNLEFSSQRSENSSKLTQAAEKDGSVWQRLRGAFTKSDDNR